MRVQVVLITLVNNHQLVSDWTFYENGQPKATESAQYPA